MGYSILIILVVLGLYLKTWKYKMLIDDHVPRDGYMYTIVDYKKEPSFYEQGRPVMATVTNIGVFLAVCGYISYMWGWKAGLMYAVFPLNVCGVAWVTGNYYMSTVLLLLSTHLLLTSGLWVGAVAMYVACLNSTISGVPYVLAALFYPMGWVMVFPTVMFIFGRRVTSGLKQRKNVHEDMNMAAGGITLWHLKNIPKVLAYYVYKSFWPSRLGLFHYHGKQEDYNTNKLLVLSIVICGVFFIWGWMIDPKMVVAWFLFMGLYSQWTTFGQFIAERYTVIPNVFFCVLMARLLDNYPIVMAVVCALWFYRSHIYIREHESNGTWMTDNARNFPKSPEGYSNLANLHMDYGRWFDAIRPLLQAERFTRGQKALVYANLSACYYHSGYFDKSEYYTFKALNEPGLNIKQRPILEKQLEEIQIRKRKIDRHRKEMRSAGVI